MTRIGFDNLLLFGFHGVQTEETTLGGLFAFHAWVELDTEKADLHDDLTATLDYTRLIAICTEENNTPSKLLEHLITRIQNRISTDFQGVEELWIRIEKRKAPIAQVLDSVWVEKRKKLSRN